MIVCSSLSLLLTALLAWRFHRLFSGCYQLDPNPSAPPAHTLSVVIPARNEERVIERLLNSLDPQDCLEVIVVDDHSTDQTATLAARHRCRVIQSAPLPDGWLGKNWALHQGIEICKGELLVCMDADTVHHPQCLATLAYALRERDLVVPIGAQELIGFWEKALPPCLWAPLLLILVPEDCADPKKPEVMLGNGQIMAFRKSFYIASGGHRAVRSKVVEDMALAQNIKKAGARSAVFFAPALTRTRMYQSFSEIWRGFSKNAAVYEPNRPGFSIAITLSTALLTIAMELWPFLMLFQGGLLSLLSAAQLLILFYARFRFYRYLCIDPHHPHFAFSTLHYLFLPIARIIGIFLSFYSLGLAFSGRKSWKGRSV